MCAGKLCAVFYIIIIVIHNVTTAFTPTKIKVPPKVKIVSHFASPPLVANCSKTSIQCLVTSPSLSSVVVWWTFRGENASKLPSVHVSKSSPNEWKLSVDCATLHHSGTYACHAALSNETQRVYRKEAVIQVYVPVSIGVIPANGVIRDLIGNKVTLKCDVTTYPKAVINWAKIVNNNELNSINGDERVQIVNNELNETRQETSLIINALSEADNGTYVCHAKNEYNNESEASLQLIVLQKAKVYFEKIEHLTARSLQLSWNVISDGNSKIKRFILEMKNYSIDANISDWMRIESDIEPDYSGSRIVQYLAPAVTYGFQLAAINGAGQSDFTSINTTMPSDVPNKISDLHVLAATNETLLIGWKRPHDNGAHISEYKMELRNVEEPSVIGETMLIKDAAQETRRNYMYIFVGLEPATKYSFQVRACSYLGCGHWSEPQLSAQTSDGYSDPPKNVRLNCNFDVSKNANYGNISWQQSNNSRGTIVGYNITIVGHAKYRNSNNQFVTDHIIEWHRINNNNTHQIQLPLKAHTNYTVHMCAINLSGCGSWSDVSNNVECATPPQLQHNFAVLKFEQTETIGQLKMVLPRISERFGVISCYRVFVIKLPFGYTLSDFPSNPSELNVTSYAQVHYHEVFEPEAYIADEINSSDFNNEVIIGDRNYSSCLRSAKVNMGLNSEAELMSNTSGVIDDGPLAELTNYTGFVEIHVLGTNGVILRKQSTYLSPMQTSSSPLLSMPTSTNAVSPLLSSIGNPSTTILLCLISGIALILLIVILILWLLIRRSNDTNTGHNVNDGTRERLTSVQQSKHVHSNGLISNGYLPSMRTNAVANHFISVMPIHVSNLAQLYRERIAQNNRLFELEFNSLPQSFDDRSTLANDVEENKHKNRLPSVKCYDQTRVRLSLTDGKPNSDYINANFVSYGDKLYVCTQGPLDSTIKDFWRMIYEYESSVIVMLTGCEEQGNAKCAQYWSDDSVKTIDDTFLVSVKSVRIYSDYIIRRFQLSTIDHKYSRDILQFHYTMWRDFSASESQPRILRFIKHVNENYCADKGPLVVHCCAGLGRSGTYIAIDSLLPEIISGFVNIYECVLNLRYQRNHCVQTLNQYIFIYRALLEFAHFGDTEVDIDHFGDYYQQILEEQIENVNLLNTQFDRLEFTIDDPKSCEYGIMPDNVNKNRCSHVIPYEINRVILPASIDDESRYINASLIQGYDRHLTFIATQDPLETTVNEFFCMVYEQNLTTIVMLSQMSDFCYWPLDEFTYKNYAVKLMSQVSNQSNEYFVTRQLQVSKLSCVIDTPHKVTLYQFLLWNNQIIPEITFPIIALCETVLQTYETNSPILVHCRDGSQRSSIFISLLSIIQQIKVDKRVDVFQTARATKLQRCSTFQTFEEYAFLYRCAMDYIESRNLCDTSDVVL